MARAGEARQRAAAARARQRQAERRKAMVRWVAIVVVVLLAAGGITAAALAGGGNSSPSTSSSGRTAPAPSPGQLGPEDMALESGQPLASSTGAAQGETVDGIQCNAQEQVAYHIHAHLAIFVNGSLRPVPIGIGIVTPVVQQLPTGDFASATRCYYWLHVHAQDGVIHVESPTKDEYTLGQFFDIWKQPLSTGHVGPASGAVTVFVDGKRFTGDPRSIGLTPHEDIQLDVGTLVAPQPVDWSKSQL